MRKVVLDLLAGEFSVCRLPAAEPVPPWAGSAVYSAVTRTADELSVACPTGQVPAGVEHAAGWRLFKFAGPFQFTDTGVLAGVLAPLAAAGIPILAQGTFNTDYLFVRTAQLEAAIDALRRAGHEVRR